MEFNLKEFKKQFSELQKKYKLPDFEKINNEFGIQKLIGQETETLLRDIRRTIVDKGLSYLRFLELLLNPTNAPIFLLNSLKNLTNEHRKIINNLYSDLCDIELDSLIADNIYNEKNEAELIKELVKKWEKIRKDMETLLKSLKKSWKKESSKINQSYHG